MMQQPTHTGARRRVSRGGRPDSGQITRSLILRTALGIIDRDGRGGCTIHAPTRRRRGARHDGALPARHEQAAVLDGAAEIVLSQLSVDTKDRDWARQLRAVAHQFHALALEHPNMVPLLVIRPLPTPLGRRPPGTLRPLEERPHPAHLRIYRVLFAYLHGMSPQTLHWPRRRSWSCGAHGPSRCRVNFDARSKSAFVYFLANTTDGRQKYLDNRGLRRPPTESAHDRWIAESSLGIMGFAIRVTRLVIALLLG